jgi:hypothetical protein
MSRTPTHRGNYRTHSARDENEPVGTVASSGHGSGSAARRIHDLLADELTLMVIVADDGQVFAVNPEGKRAKLVEAEHVHWIVSTYTAAYPRDDLEDDIRARAKELRRVAA